MAPPPSEDRRQESQPAQNGVELNKDGSSATYVALRRFTDVYGLIKRDYIAPVPFPDLVENTPKGLQELLGKERLFYVRSNNRFSISCSGEDLTVENVADETRRVRGFADIFALARRTNSELPMPAVIDASAKGLAQVHTPKGNLIDKKGIVPDVLLISNEEGASLGLKSDRPKIIIDPKGGLRNGAAPGRSPVIPVLRTSLSWITHGSMFGR